MKCKWGDGKGKDYEWVKKMIWFLISTRTFWVDRSRTNSMRTKCLYLSSKFKSIAEKKKESNNNFGHILMWFFNTCYYFKQIFFLKSIDKFNFKKKKLNKKMKVFNFEISNSFWKFWILTSFIVKLPFTDFKNHYFQSFYNFC